MNDIEKEIERLTEALDAVKDPAERAELIFRRGRLRWRFEDRAGAMGDYAEAASLDPSGGAPQALRQAQEIMAFFNKDLYNP